MEDAGGDGLAQWSPVDTSFPAMFVEVVFVDFEQEAGLVFSDVEH